MYDQANRDIHCLRLSLTESCNLRCCYCRPQEPAALPPQELTDAELLHLVQLFAACGIDTLRLTGGEPLLRAGVPQLTARLKAVPGIRKVTLTTNGTLLEPHIPLLRRIGVSAVNLSLDSFDRETFARVTGRDLLPPVLAALDGLLAAGVRVKINVVAMRGVNDGQMDDFVHAARTMPLDLRFIEFMPMGSGTLWSPENFWSADDIREEAARRARLIPVSPDEPGAEAESGPARMYRIEGGQGRLGFISPLTNHFCLTCNRLRLTSEGALRTCLFADKEYRLRGLLRHPRITDEILAGVIRRACADKPVGADLLRARRAGAAVADRQMVGIGG